MTKLMRKRWDQGGGDLLISDLGSRILDWVKTGATYWLSVISPRQGVDRQEIIAKMNCEWRRLLGGMPGIRVGSK